jgi:hypothetical protein
VAVLSARLGLRPEGTGLAAAPVPGVGRVRVTGLHVGERAYEVRVDDASVEVIASVSAAG